MFERERPKQFKKIEQLNVTFNIPRYVTIDFNQEIKVTNDQFDFTEVYYYLKGQWLLILKQHGDGVYLSKKKVK